MKHLIFLVSTLLVSLVSSASAQSEEKKYQLEFNVAPKIVHQKAGNPDAGEFSNDFSLSMEFNHLINSRGHFGLSYGLSYSLIQLNQVDYLAAFFDCDRINPGTFTFNTSWVRNDIKIHYLGIPMDLLIKPKKGDNVVYLKLGAEPLFKFHQNTDSYLVMCGAPEVDTQNKEFTETKSLPLRYRFGLGCDFLVGTKYKMIIEVNYEFIDSYLYENPAILGGYSNNIKIREYGIRVGLRM